ncbi:large-conductance mechanosensitive channel protein MscL [Lentzea flaviverrucosa]|uniref:Large-conductance mechanosensitive channel n=1 Tax=Lentzea flaviverrucosa TaxID=200379 RepID=A0A1H9M6L2_9PSEU|nr:large-conductance mechanosensitive channel protein MscL [Lentzea flaviverrucosa]RDI31054.1 large conductance mechanosensitive channel [Lentzea flaviverrucosa]SER19334.1 large conductance mechanosensitive channel [Lentzea flaviverrucosa]
MLKGFKDFLMRGNVVDLAVAVVIGTAFTAIVTAFTTSLIKPLISSLGSTETKGLGIQLREGKEDTYLDFSNVINATINFVIVAAVVYFVLVLPIQKIQERRKRGEEAGPSEPTNVELLIEIRDLLAAQQQPTTTVQNTAPDRRGPAI